MIYYFHRLSFFSIALNLWVGINLALESLSALLAIGLAQISPDQLAGPFVKLTELLNWFLLAVPQTLIENDLACDADSRLFGKFRGGLSALFSPTDLSDDPFE